MTTDSNQGSLEWLQDRCGYATASRFKDVMSGKDTIGHRQYVAELALERITGLPTESMKPTKDMERGTELEPLARLQYMLNSRNTVTESPFLKHETLMYGASPDGLIGDDGMVEFKCPKAHNHLIALKKGVVPPEYKWQVVGQLLVTGRKWNDFVSFHPDFPGKSKLAIVRYERNEEDIKKLEAGLTAFLAEIEETVKFIEGYGGN